MKRLAISSALLVAATSFGFGATVHAAVAESTTNLPSVLTCGGKATIRPTSYILACADANSYFKAIKWVTWGPTSATGTATYAQNDCEPNCAAGKFEYYPATLKLSQPKSTKLGRLFSAVSYTYQVSESTTLPLTKL